MNAFPSPEELSLLTSVYRDFNARHIDAVLARMSPDVDWPNGMEGGRVKGHQGVRDLDQKLLSDTIVRHAYTIQDGQIVKMDIE